MKQYMYEFTPEQEGTVAGLVICKTKKEAKNEILEEIKRNYQGLKLKMAKRSLHIACL